MPFENETTFVRMQKQGREAEFHERYERALEDVRRYFGKEYPNIVVRDITEERKIKDVSPIDGSEIATFQLASKESVGEALDVLNRNYRSWYWKGYVHRAMTFLRAAEMLSERKFEFAALLTYENGKNRTEAMADVDEGIDFMRYYALNLIENQGFNRFTGRGYDNEESMSYMKPYGVFAVIAPFNFFAITVGMTTGPLITGNAVVLKPSSDIPLASYLFVRLLHEAGVPKEVLAFLSGSGGVVGTALVEDPRIGGLVFTGSKDVGMKLFHKISEKVPKPAITEMGGKDCVVVTNRANLDKAVQGVIRAAFGYAGQKCSAASLVFVQSGVYDRFLDMLVKEASKIKPDDPRKKETFLNPVVNRDAFEKYRNLIPTLQKEGRVLTGARVEERPGFYVHPTIVADLSDDAYTVRNELFLPILGVLKFSTLEEAVRRINSLDYGLTGGIFSEDPEEVRYYFENIDVGVVYANRARGASTGAMVGSQPFVGWKLSGSTGKGTGSYYYLQQFLREQAVTVAHPEDIHP
ncbi:1-pyrroline-5-carboxylate dehydrogenase 2 [Thermogymnomonas acidicola]|uniref:L-glutamate gamma-semialdehyde dehydrogenase n=1 Tax=Thermogymnomonas acidicola TaxID=399579 RepID=A0AA37BRZ2_9ARCH|nr:aldehyde dehydrogenase family protein [Thermogymnomonas acidicola]GGM74260.1 1-pyrroline-5-carboxylate dehydrogenase 2 [Thermogymnomonas acidicola]